MSAKRCPTARFRIGRIVATPNALSVITQAEILTAITRHQAGDWGDVPPKDQNANEQALLNGKRVVSSFRSTKGLKFWVITEADRSSTTILLPEDY
jgi:hypothetical protein